MVEGEKESERKGKNQEKCQASQDGENVFKNKRGDMVPEAGEVQKAGNGDGQ